MFVGFVSIFLSERMFLCRTHPRPGRVCQNSVAYRYPDTP
jgi:hypothetical protein